MRLRNYLLFLPICFFAFNVFAQPAGYSTLFNSSTFSRSIDVSKAVGTLGGSAGTSATGGVTYSIPIICAPGTNGVKPEISLEYNSQSGSGLLGQGWNISGLSVISRAGQDLYHDGKAGPVTYTDNDAFLLDGKRLRVVSGGNGADGSTYQTEEESYAVITSLGRVSDCPEKFRLVAKDGKILEYGYTPSSTIQVDGDSKIMMWRLNKIQDIHGNYIEFVYDNTNRDSRISQIKYTGNSVTGLSPYNTMNFEYMDRYYDKNTLYEGGKTMKQHYLLANIKIYSEGVLYKTYSCNYGLNSLGISFLKYIDETSSTGSKLHDTRFLYGDESSALSVTSSNITAPLPGTGDMYYGTSEVYLNSGDYDGDGINELIINKLSYSPTSMGGGGIKHSWSARAYKSGGYGSSSYTETSLYSSDDVKNIAGLRASTNSLSLAATSTRLSAYSSVGFADFNGDGKEDLLSYSITSGGELDKMSIFYPTTTSGVFDEVNVAPMIKPAMYSANRFVPNNFVTIGDFDGDNATDFITVIQDIHNTRLGTISFPRKDELNKYMTWDGGAPGYPGTYDPDPEQGDRFADADKVVVFDFDGDGKSDILIIKWPTAIVYSVKKRAHGGYTLEQKYAGAFPLMTDFDEIQVGDFNGDGKSDLLLHKASGAPNFEVAYSTGTGFNRVTQAFTFFKTCSYGPADKFFVADFNNDGKSDILIMNRYCTSEYFSKTKFNVYFSCGNQFVGSRTLEYNGYVNPKIEPIVMDANGDGVLDLCFQSSSSSYLQFLTCETKYKSLLLQKVTDGLNRTTEFTYEPLTKGTGSGAGDFYTKGSGATYPVNNGQYPVYVATTLKVPNGIGGTNTSSYKYENLQIHRGGRGLLGFGKIKTINSAADVRTEDIYDFNSDFYVPYLKTSKTFLNSTGTQLTQSDFTMTFTRIGSSYCYKQENTGSVVGDKLKGITTTTTNTYDAYGYVTNNSSVTTGGLTFTTSTELTYTTIAGMRKPAVKQVTTQRGSLAPVIAREMYIHDLNGLLAKRMTNPLYIAENLEYDAYGNITKSQKRATSGVSISLFPETLYEYDDKGRFVKKETDPAGGVKETTTHPFWGTPLSIKGINGKTTFYTYDSWGKIKTTTVPTVFGSYIINYSDGWASGGNLLTYTLMQDPSAPDKKTSYDLFGREVKTEQESFKSIWATTTTTYDERGNVATVSEPYLPTESAVYTTNTYDEYNRIKTVIDVFGGLTSYNYSGGAGLMTTSVTLPDGKTNITTVDALGKVYESSRGMAGKIRFTYDSRGNETLSELRQFSSSGQELTSKEYDARGRLVKLKDADAGTTTYKYNDFGQLTEQTNAAGKTTKYYYNVLGKVIRKELDVCTTEYTYYGSDKEYRLQKETVITGGSTVEDIYDYHVGGGIHLHEKHINGTFLGKYFGYDSYDRHTTTEYPLFVASWTGSRFKKKNHYDANGFLTKITTDLSGTGTGEKTLYEVVAMNGRGDVTKCKRVDGAISTISYNNSIPTGFSTPGVQELVLDYNYNNGNLTYREDMRMGGLRESFQYDAADRLIRADAERTGFAGPIHYPPMIMQYDSYLWSGSFGKMVSKSDIGEYKYGNFPRNAVTSVSDPSGLISHATQQITYTPFQKTALITETIGGVDYQEEFAYDARENRAYSKQLQGGVLARERWYVDDYEMQKIGSNTQYVHYIYGGNGICGIIVEEAGSFNYYAVYTDHLNSINQVVTETGAFVAELSYDVWGKEEPSSKPDWLYRGYTGHEMLNEYGLINMNGRMYDPANGRMLSPDNYVQDPMNSQCYNRYSYCYNNPLKYTDPDGNNPMVIAAVIGGVINGAMYAYNVSRSEGGWSNWDWGMFGYQVGMGAIGGVMGNGIGTAFAGGTIGGSVFLNEVAKAGLHGISGYIMSGGNKNAFLSGALSSAAGSFSEQINGAVGATLNTTVGGTIFAAGIGGATSVLGGGNFWQGASIAAMVHLVNQDMHKSRSLQDFVPEGYIKLEEFTQEQLNDIRIIPENASDPLTTPTKNGLYCGDGFYFRGGNDNKYWYKVSNGGGVRVTAINSTSTGYTLRTQPIPNRFWKMAAEYKHKEYFIGWKPRSQPHTKVNPFVK